MSLEMALTDMQTKIGTETGVSDWLTITQEMIDQFANATLDKQWIHVDVERAKAESPFGGPVAHGYLTLSLVAFLAGNVDPDRPKYSNVKLAVNYGLNKVRFPNPVLAGSNVRARVTPLSVEEVAGNGLQMVNKVTVEIEDVAKPACVAETVSRLYFE